MSDVNFDKFSSCLSWQVLNKNRGRLTEPVVFFIDHYMHYVLSFQFCLVFSSQLSYGQERKREIGVI